MTAGETLAIPRSGCGKTTVLRLIAGLEQPDPGGRIVIGESDVTYVPTERRGVGMVFQNYALFPNLSLADNIGYGLGCADSMRSAAVSASTSCSA